MLAVDCAGSDAGQTLAKLDKTDFRFVVIKLDYLLAMDLARAVVGRVQNSI